MNEFGKVTVHWKKVYTYSCIEGLHNEKKKIPNVSLTLDKFAIILSVFPSNAI